MQYSCFPVVLRSLGPTLVPALAIVLMVVGFASERANAQPNDPPDSDQPKAFRKLRQSLARRHGATPASEAAVDAGLKWLTAQQAADGHWSFDGAMKNDIAATAFGLLPLLGAGITHLDKEEPYSANVRSGLNWLMSQQSKEGRFGVDTLYTHGLAAMAVCQAYALTADPKLEASARKATEFILNAQHVGGGWRYAPGQAGDTSVTGWQIQALTLADLAGVAVSSEAGKATMKYLDSVQGPDGGYGYVQPRSTPTMTAAGLLCRLQLGWNESNPDLKSGLTVLKATPPGAGNNLYHDYYATQVMFLVGGKEWDDWNPKMRDLLVKKQDHKQEAAQRGSWSPVGDALAGNGGRLMATSFALLILEVYYRGDMILERQAAKVGERELAELWKRMGEEGGFNARRSLYLLSRHPRRVVEFATERLKAIPLPTAEELERMRILIRELNDDEFRIREAATTALEKLGTRAEPILRQALADQPSPEVRRRVEPLLAKCEATNAEERRRTRLVLNLLEQLGTPEAQAVLKRLAEGVPDHWLTLEAKAALNRVRTP